MVTKLLVEVQNSSQLKLSLLGSAGGSVLNRRLVVQTANSSTPLDPVRPMFIRKATIPSSAPTTVLNYLVPEQPTTDQSPHAKSQAVLTQISPLLLPVFLILTRLLQPPPSCSLAPERQPAVSHKLLVWVGGSSGPFLRVHFKLSSPHAPFSFPRVHVKWEHAVFAVLYLLCVFVSWPLCSLCSQNDRMSVLFRPD